MPLSRIKYLLERYYAGNCTPEEMQELDNWYASLDLENADQPGYTDRQEEEKDRQREIFFQDFTKRLAAQERSGNTIMRSMFPLKKWLRIAAILVGVGCIGTYLWYHHSDSQVTISQQFTADVPPGGNRAVLTLANGSRIILDSAHNGMLAQQGSTNVLKLDSGRLSYQLSASKQPATITYNSISTPRGGQYQVILPDGSKVWLNAASSLRFPTAFTGKKREVELTGEAYFEITRDADMPFMVHISSSLTGTKGSTVEVLGTSFNVMAYEEEGAIKTTLLEGAIKITNGETSILLHPGQQAILNEQEVIKLVNEVNVDQVIAWKNGLFQFEGNDIRSVMRQISRWYNVEVKYEGNIPDHFVGTLSRNVNVSKVFKILEMAGNVHFKIEDRSVIVSP